MRIAWFTPVREGPIAEYSRGVLAAMVRLCEPCLFGDGLPHRFPAGIPTRDLAAGPQALSDLSSFDAVFYNLGNDFQQYGWIYDVARLHPGIVVLHDRTLHRLFLDYYLRHMRRPDSYVARMAEHHGIEGLKTAHRVLGPWFEPESVRLDDDDLLRYTFTEEALQSASGAVVHSQWHGAIVRRAWTGPVCEAWLPTQRPTASFVPADLGRNGLDGDRITLITIGAGEPGSHVAEVVDLLAEDPDLAARTQYVIAGTFDPGEMCGRRLMTQIAESGLTGCVRMLGSPPPAEVDRWARAADVFVNLQHPEVGGCSLYLMYELPFGKPVITYDTGSFAEVPDDVVAKVAPGDRAGLRGRVREFVDSAARRHAIGTAGKRFADGHGARDYARELLRFAGSDGATPLEDSRAWDGSRAIAEQIASRLGETLVSLGVTPSSPGVEAVIREASGLLWPPGRSGR